MREPGERIACGESAAAGAVAFTATTQPGCTRAATAAFDTAAADNSDIAAAKQISRTCRVAFRFRRFAAVVPARFN